MLFWFVLSFLSHETLDIFLTLLICLYVFGCCVFYELSVYTCICASHASCFVFFFLCLTYSGLFACLFSKEKEKQGWTVGEDVRGDEGEEKLIRIYSI